MRSLLVKDADCPHCLQKGVSVTVPFPLSKKDSTHVRGWVPIKALPWLRFGGAFQSTVVCERCNNPVTLEFDAGRITWKHYIAFAIFIPMVLIYLYLWLTGQIPQAAANPSSDCLSLVNDAATSHAEMREVFTAYQNLRADPSVESHVSQVLQAADHTLELVTKTLNQWVDVLVCMEVIEHDFGKGV